MNPFKKVLILLFAVLLSFRTFAETPPTEGMWIPLLLKELNITDMQSKGLKLSAEDIYAVNKSSLKDAIISFGGFCTGSVISPEGLLITNHHCGYGQIQQHSSVEHDYLTDGFWAMQKKDELPNPGLTATFIVRIEDVTEKVLNGTNPQQDEAERSRIVSANISDIEAKSVEGTEYKAKIKDFFYGNEYYMFITETFRDIRMVGAPPSAIGKFGGDTDNWMWPRHTGDFSIFRIYANKDNKPADYAEDNVPYKPKNFLKVNLAPKQKGDFTMVFGFPGRTEEYLSSYAVKHIYSVSNPAKIKIRERRLEIMRGEMAKSDAVRIQYAAKYAQISNYHKKWIGENRGLKKLDAINRKREIESRFSKWIAENPDRNEKYGGILPRFKEIYDDLDALSISRDYVNEAGFGIEMVGLAFRLQRLVETAKNGGTEAEVKAEIGKARDRADAHFKDYFQPIDRVAMTDMLRMYYQDIRKEDHPDVMKTIESKYKGNFDAYTSDVFKKSVFASREKTMAALDKFNWKKMEADPGYQLMNSIIGNFREKIAPQLYDYLAQIDKLNRSYVKGLREMMTDKVFYPDANSTLRLTYGQVDDYKPADGVFYKHYTSLSGIMDKNASGEEDYIVPDRLRKLWAEKDFGPYAENGEIVVCFTGSNHTTGGNSGSPVLNGKGELIGVNFDRNWEGTMSDIMYDPDRCRNIAVDMRYVLFVVDRYAGASHLVKELSLVQ
ncbi:MAG: S46 family peptidase [Bacteroidia bacterium]|nr:S46 family peptidase [Bacteroidia bacterium]